MQSASAGNSCCGFCWLMAARPNGVQFMPNGLKRRMWPQRRRNSPGRPRSYTVVAKPSFCEYRPASRPIGPAPRIAIRRASLRGIVNSERRMTGGLDNGMTQYPSTANLSSHHPAIPSFPCPALAVALGDGAPVDDVPPAVNIIGALVLVFEVIGMLPDVYAQDRLLAVHQRVVLVGPADDFHFAVVH